MAFRFETNEQSLITEQKLTSDWLSLPKKGKIINLENSQ